MNGPWFDANHWAWLPGSLFGCLTGTWGAFAGYLAPRGKARGFVIGYGVLLQVIAAASLGVGVAALLAGQPYAIWFFFTFLGAQGTILMPMFLALIRRRYREAEQRRIQAEDL